MWTSKEWIGSTVSTLAIYMSTRPNLSPSFRKGQDTIEWDTPRFGCLKSLFSILLMLRSFWAPFNNSVHVDAWWWGIFVNWIRVFQSWSNYSVLFIYLTTANSLGWTAVLTASSNMHFVIICTSHLLHGTQICSTIHFQEGSFWRESVHGIWEGDGISTLITTYQIPISWLAASDWNSIWCLSEDSKSWSGMTSSIGPGLLVDLRICPRTQQSQGLWPVPRLPRGIWKELIVMDMDESHLGLVDIGWRFHDRSLGYEWCRNWSSYMFLSFSWQWLRCESMCVNNGKLLRFLSDRLCAHMLLPSPVRIKWMAQLPNVYICCFFRSDHSITCIPVCVIPGVSNAWFRTFMDVGGYGSKTYMVCPHKSQHYFETWGLEKGLSFFNYRDLFGVQFVFAGVCFRLRQMWDTFLTNIHRYDVGQKVRSSTSITSSTTSLTSFLGQQIRTTSLGVYAPTRVDACLFECLELEIVWIKLNSWVLFIDMALITR